MEEEVERVGYELVDEEVSVWKTRLVPRVVYDEEEYEDIEVETVERPYTYVDVETYVIKDVPDDDAGSPVFDRLGSVRLPCTTAAGAKHARRCRLTRVPAVPQPSPVGTRRRGRRSPSPGRRSSYRRSPNRSRFSPARERREQASRYASYRRSPQRSTYRTSPHRSFHDLTLSPARTPRSGGRTRARSPRSSARRSLRADFQDSLYDRERSWCL